MHIAQACFTLRKPSLRIVMKLSVKYMHIKQKEPAKLLQKISSAEMQQRDKTVKHFYYKMSFRWT